MTLFGWMEKAMIPRVLATRTVLNNVAMQWSSRIFPFQILAVKPPNSSGMTQPQPQQRQPQRRRRAPVDRALHPFLGAPLPTGFRPRHRGHRRLQQRHARLLRPGEQAPVVRPPGLRGRPVRAGALVPGARVDPARPAAALFRLVPGDGHAGALPRGGQEAIRDPHRGAERCEPGRGLPGGAVPGRGSLSGVGSLPAAQQIQRGRCSRQLLLVPLGVGDQFFRLWFVDHARLSILFDREEFPATTAAGGTRHRRPANKRRRRGQQRPGSSNNNNNGRRVYFSEPRNTTRDERRRCRAEKGDGTDATNRRRRTTDTGTTPVQLQHIRWDQCHRGIRGIRLRW
mmetsp:Transcript_32483/g.67873  ORF Transcript_32483/g.67873 Transcript_32483/m.67873 type:complete len:341 (+) Transcript_32483:686-1708(+)